MNCTPYAFINNEEYRDALPVLKSIVRNLIEFLEDKNAIKQAGYSSHRHYRRSYDATNFVRDEICVYDHYHLKYGKDSHFSVKLYHASDMNEFTHEFHINELRNQKIYYNCLTVEFKGPIFIYRIKKFLKKYFPNEQLDRYYAKRNYTIMDLQIPTLQRYRSIGHKPLEIIDNWVDYVSEVEIQPIITTGIQPVLINKSGYHTFGSCIYTRVFCNGWTSFPRKNACTYNIKNFTVLELIKFGNFLRLFTLNPRKFKI